MNFDDDSRIRVDSELSEYCARRLKSLLAAKETRFSRARDRLYFRERESLSAGYKIHFTGRLCVCFFFFFSSLPLLTFAFLTYRARATVHQMESSRKLPSSVLSKRRCLKSMQGKFFQSPCAAPTSEVHVHTPRACRIARLDRRYIFSRRPR